MMWLDYLRDFNTGSVLLRLTLAVLCGGMIGINREHKRRPAGFRTYMLVCLGAALTGILSQYLWVMINTQWAEVSHLLNKTTDVTRIGAKAIGGVGFLGAGTILVTRQNQVRGLTTAAGLWSVACLGLALGAGFYTGALVSFAAIWISIKLLRIVDRHLHAGNSDFAALRVEFSTMSDMSNFISFAKQRGCVVENLEMTRIKNSDDTAVISAVITLRFNKTVTFPQIVEIYGNLEGVLMMETL